MKTISSEELKTKLLQNYVIIDVRAPIEFSQGSLPNSVNLPLLDDNERALVGTCYKKSGREKAIELGYQIVSGANKTNKIKKWQDFLTNNPRAIITCYRGGLRSQIAQSFLSEAGVEISRIEEGYKSVRQYFIEALHEALDEVTPKNNLKLLTGSTGSGKTKLLQTVQDFQPIIDLEHLAEHRGSAFGGTDLAQPAQATFENNLSYEILKLREKKPKKFILFEDESRVIGSLHLPEILFSRMRESSVIKMDVSLQDRIENIYADYIYPSEAIFSKYLNAISKIKKKLGGLRAEELLNDIRLSQRQFFEEGLLVSNKVWIEKLLVWYYDPLYAYSLDFRKPKIEFAGPPADIIDYLKHRNTEKNTEV